MGSKIDVLAVIDREVRRAGGESYPDGCDLLEARAAVAELIEAVEYAAKAARFDNNAGSWVQYSLRFRESKDRLSKAVARVRGDA